MPFNTNCNPGQRTNTSPANSAGSASGSGSCNPSPCNNNNSSNNCSASQNTQSAQTSGQAIMGNDPQAGMFLNQLHNQILQNPNLVEVQIKSSNVTNFLTQYNLNNQWASRVDITDPRSGETDVFLAVNKQAFLNGAQQNNAQLAQQDFSFQGQDGNTVRYGTANNDLQSILGMGLGSSFQNNTLGPNDLGDLTPEQLATINGYRPNDFLGGVDNTANTLAGGAGAPLSLPYIQENGQTRANPLFFPQIYVGDNNQLELSDPEFLNLPTGQTPPGQTQQNTNTSPLAALMNLLMPPQGQNSTGFNFGTPTAQSSSQLANQFLPTTNTLNNIQATGQTQQPNTLQTVFQNLITYLSQLTPGNGQQVQ